MNAEIMNFDEDELNRFDFFQNKFISVDLIFSFSFQFDFKSFFLCCPKIDCVAIASFHVSLKSRNGWEKAIKRKTQRGEEKRFVSTRGDCIVHNAFWSSMTTTSAGKKWIASNEIVIYCSRNAFWLSQLTKLQFDFLFHSSMCFDAKCFAFGTDRRTEKKIGRILWIYNKEPWKSLKMCVRVQRNVGHNAHRQQHEKGLRIRCAPRSTRHTRHSDDDVKN